MRRLALPCCYVALSHCVVHGSDALSPCCLILKMMRALFLGLLAIYCVLLGIVVVLGVIGLLLLVDPGVVVFDALSEILEGPIVNVGSIIYYVTNVKKG